MTIQTIQSTPVSTRNLLIQSISAILTRAIESKETILVAEVAARIAAEVEPSEEDICRLHRRVRKAISGALEEAGLMLSEKYREEYSDDYEWGNQVAYAASEEVRRLPSEWRDESDADRAMCSEQDIV